jgi:hypothetical protein
VAKRNYLVEGLSGAGKSSVYEELIRSAYKAISTDRAWKRRDDSSMWDEQKALGELERPEPDVLFVCGSSRNRARFLPYFTKVFNLRIDDDTMLRRLHERTNNDYGKQPDELELMLTLNRSGEKLAGAIDVDATQPLRQVVDDVLRLADCRPVNSDARPAPWSGRASALVHSFVISETALPIGASDELRDVLCRETIARIEYAWSGSVLGTLLRYLGEQGIDLLHSDQVSTLSRSGEASVLVLTSDHRERYVARLDPSWFDGAALRRHYEECNEMEADGVEYALLDGIAFLRDTLEPLASGLVAVLVSG